MIQTKKQQHENKIKYTVFNQRKQIPLSTVKKFEKSFKVSYFYNFMNLGIEEQLYIYYLWIEVLFFHHKTRVPFDLK